MLLSALLVVANLIPPLAGQAEVAHARIGTLRAPAPEATPYYRHVARAVSNWREQAGAELRPVSLAVVAQLAPDEPAFVARCARLNNYWCIKSARWAGEVGADTEGHTGFATAADGADAAAGLLRRYYRDYGRRTALAIVRRWAPAACGPPVAAPPVAAARPSALAPRGLSRTLRARYLARHLPGGSPRRTALRVQPWSALARMGARRGARPLIRTAAPPVADIASGLAAGPGPLARTSAPRGVEDPVRLLDRRVPSPDRLVAESASLPVLAAGLSLGDLRAPAPLCDGDAVRIANYAASIAASAGVHATDDLALFAPDGRPLPNLARVMRAMSAVELGALHAGAPLIEAAIARLRPVAASTADAAK